MKYVILIHSNPRALGPPDASVSPTRAGPRAEEWHDEHRPRVRGADGGDLRLRRVRHGEALADPASSTLFGWSPEGHLRTDGPYAETKEQLAGFFLIDCETRERAEEIAAHFAQPGGTVELRPAMWGDGDDQ